MTAISISKGVIKDIIIVVVGVIIIWIGLQLVFGTQNPFYVVSSGSMIPVLQVYDVLVVQGNEPFEEVEVGDIIVFNRPSDHDRVIVHRVASIINEDPLTIRTKGDANPASIPGTDFPITEEEYIGQVAYVIPQVGYITRILQPPINYIIIVIIIGVMVAKQFSKKKNEKAKDAPKEIDSKFTDLTQPKQDIQNLADLDNIPKDSEYSKESGLDSNEKSDVPQDTKDTKLDKKE
ncbi:signal peptidase I [Nitrosopumilus sp. b1]|uniref:signal peptidase I n=1 Tax=Nitrosopumilus sp. b1 TaxID=2109907 RepID=UPI0015F62968|nr:signal peptidase I [Nitrosopumilus sp. b1]KAF6243951.1 signal peptidase I [Nitrosopumilus sp. b1]